MTATTRTMLTAATAVAVSALTAASAAAAQPASNASSAGITSAQITASSSAARVVTAKGPLRDLAPAAVGPLDGARAVLVMVSHHGRSLVVLQVQGIDRSAAGHRFGAHLHVGPCVAGDGAAAGPHYNTDVIAGRVPPRIDPTTEVWLDFTVTRGGTGAAITVVPFAPLPGDRSIVIHQDQTDEQGAAGPRLACLPVSVG